MNSNKMKIAIVDDHALFRKSLLVLINLFPRYRVIFDSANGMELINQLNPFDLPDIILMDISMPLMDGYESTAWLKSNHPQIKVLALSTMDSEPAIIKMIKAGAKGFVLKDADPDELKRAFDEVLMLGYYYNDLVTRKVMNSIHQLTQSDSEINVFARLSKKEIEFLKLCCTELTYKEIADQMCLSARTIEGYRDSLCEKLGLKTRVGLAMYAVKNRVC